MKARHPGETLDRILGGTLSVVQPRHGYRFSVDALLLARFIRARSHDRVLELGAGSGIVSMILANTHQLRSLTAIELQPDLAEMAGRNFAGARLDNCVSLCADLRLRRIEGLEPGNFDLVIANPPYRAPRSGRESPNPSRRIARGGETTLREFVAAASRYTINGGRVAMIFAAARSAELMSEFRGHRLEPKRLRFVHPRLDRPASMILVEARKGGGIEAAIEPPLILYSAPGVYSREAHALLRGIRSEIPEP